jgi:ankyrin repeat protein
MNTRTFLRILQATAVLTASACSGLAQTRDELFEAIEAGKASKVEQILKSKPELANDADEGGFAPLTRAAGDPAVWKVLLANAAAVNSPPMTHVTVLQSAIMCEDFALVEALVAKGCRVEDRNMMGETAFHWLAYVNDKEKAEKIFAIIYQRIPKLIDDAMSNNEATIFTGTPLNNAVDRLNPVAAELLVKHGADPNKQPRGSGSSAAEFLRKRMAEEPNLRAELQAVAQAMGVTP